MQISSRFTLAVHILIVIETFKHEQKVTSELMASSANVNPTVIRRLLQQLKKADIVTVRRGSGGADITRPLEDIFMKGSVVKGEDGLSYLEKTDGPCIRRDGNERITLYANMAKEAPTVLALQNFAD